MHQSLYVSLFFPLCLVLAFADNKSGAMDEVWANTKPYTGPHKRGVDPSTLKGKVMCGYQGWFAAERDGSGRGWVHYGKGKKFSPDHCTIDLWPDMREYDADEKYATSFNHADGSTAHVFSSYNKKTVIRHFSWMEEAGIDGVFLQRFGSALRSPLPLNHRNRVTANVQAGANLHGRTWAMMYDLSGLKKGEINKFVMEDWKRLVDQMKIREDRAYLHHEGKPVIAVWGVGFGGGRDYTLGECEELVRFLKNDKRYGGNTVMLGVPSFWRELKRDAVKDELLHRIIESADIVSPWTVGRYSTPQQAWNHADSVIEPDMKWTGDKGVELMPVVFPGFSWHNLKKSQGEPARLNQIPRLQGAFFWSQVEAYHQAGARMLYIAMFDEVDEGTAIFKCTNDPPAGKAEFLTYEGLPTDHYLKLAGKAGRLLRSEQREAR